MVYQISNHHIQVVMNNFKCITWFSCLWRNLVFWSGAEISMTGP